MTKVNAGIVENLTEERHVLKALEECAELSEVLLKYLNKAPQYKPGKEKIIEEMGDVMYRLGVLAKKMNIEGEVSARLEEKTIQINEWYMSKNDKRTS